uniref:(northern house mosquito) hypothetical protein n=1 Tax=Culex pipiens TaxID=7175 RepID=A0A8D8FMD4_CULPI
MLCVIFAICSNSRFFCSNSAFNAISFELVAPADEVTYEATWLVSFSVACESAWFCNSATLFRLFCSSDLAFFNASLSAAIDLACSLKSLVMACNASTRWFNCSLRLSSTAEAPPPAPCC